MATFATSKSLQNPWTIKRLKMNKYYVHIPVWISTASVIYGINKKDAINKFKHKHGFVRMPKGYGIWIS
jgi:hypothetical protein